MDREPRARSASRSPLGARACRPPAAARRDPRLGPSRARARRARGSRAPSWRHGARALVLVLVMVVATGVATAAVLLSGTRHSAPLAGTFPGSRKSLSSTSYRIGFTPDITGGVVGWCDQIDFTTRLVHPTKRDHFARVYGTFGGGAAGCGSGPTAAEPFIDSDVVGGSGGRDGRHFSYQVAYYLTAPQVAAVRASPDAHDPHPPRTGAPRRLPRRRRLSQQERGGTPRTIGAFGPVALAGNGRELARRHPPRGTAMGSRPTVSWRRTSRGGRASPRRPRPFMDFQYSEIYRNVPLRGSRRRAPARSTAPVSPGRSSSSATSSCRSGRSRR